MKQFKKSKFINCFYMIEGGTVLEVVCSEVGNMIATLDLSDVEDDAIESTSDEFFKVYETAAKIISEIALFHIPSVFSNDKMRAFHK